MKNFRQMKKEREIQIITRYLLLSAPPEKVWDALTNPRKTQRFMFNCTVKSRWEPGSAITWKGNYKGYESGERGIILEYRENKLLKYTSFDPGFGLPDVPENHLHIAYSLEPENTGTLLTTVIENFNGDLQRTGHIATGWDTVVLPSIKKIFDS